MATPCNPRGLGHVLALYKADQLPPQPSRPPPHCSPHHHHQSNSAATMADKESDIARSVLGHINNTVIPTVKQNQQVVQEFLNQLQQSFSRSTGSLRQAKPLLPGAHHLHGGSAYEGLSVKTKTDFDIQIILNAPYVAKNFEIHRDYPSNFFLMRWNTPTQQGFLNAPQLQEQLFDELLNHVRCLRMERVRVVSYKKGLAAVNVTIVSTSRPAHPIEIDLAPQIAACEWGGCPGLAPLSRLPAELQRYIATLQANSSPIFTFSPAVPGRQPGQQRLCNISFAMLEKEFLKSNTNIRDMVRLVKLTGEARQWKKKYGLKSYFIKRVAVKYSDDLKPKSLWQGYQALLCHLHKELEHSGTIDGFFVANQNAYKKPACKLQELKQAIAEAHDCSPNQLRDMI